MKTVRILKIIRSPLLRRTVTFGIVALYFLAVWFAVFSHTCTPCDENRSDSREADRPKIHAKKSKCVTCKFHDSNQAPIPNALTIMCPTMVAKGYLLSEKVLCDVCHISILQIRAPPSFIL